MAFKKLFLIFLFVALFLNFTPAAALTVKNPSDPLNLSSMVIGNFLDNSKNPSLINASLGYISPGRSVKISWKREHPEISLSKYVVKYGCDLVANVLNDDDGIIKLSNDFITAATWTAPINPGQNCYCKIWVYAYDARGQVAGITNSRPVYICSAKTQGTRGKLFGQEGVDYAFGEILVKFNPAKINLATPRGKAAAAFFGQNKGLKLKESIPDENTAVFSFDKNKKSVAQAYADLRSDTSGSLAIVEPNYFLELHASPDDAEYASQWAMPKIEADKAWDIFTGDKSVIVALMDSGVDYNIDDLKDNMWDGSKGCKSVEGGSITCPNHGWDVSDNDNDPMLDWGLLDNFSSRSIGSEILNHGTAMAGAIGAVGNNKTGIAGMNWKISLMAIKVYGKTSEKKEGVLLQNTADWIKGINFAKNNGAKILNISAGMSPSEDRSPETPKSEYYAIAYEALKKYADQGGLIVMSAGNGGVDAEWNFPCAYPLPNKICVAGTDSDDKLFEVKKKNSAGEEKVFAASNFSDKYVEIAAPGKKVLSAGSKNIYPEITGTSIGAAMTSGLAALLKGYKPSLTAAEIKKIILETGDDVAALKGKTVTGKRVNAYKALLKAKEQVKEAPLKLSVITESVDYNEKAKSVEMKASVWGFKDKRDIKYWFDLTLEDKEGKGTITYTEGLISILNPAIRQFGDTLPRIFSSKAYKLAALQSGEMYCFTPFAKDVKTGVEAHGATLCFPDFPWVRTNPEKISASNFAMNGEITKYTGKKKLIAYFQYYSEDDPIKIYDTDKQKLDKYPSVKTFTQNISYKIDGSGLLTMTAGSNKVSVSPGMSFCYRACAADEGVSAIKTVILFSKDKFMCGQDVCYKNREKPPEPKPGENLIIKTIKIEKLATGGTRFIGNVSGIASGAQYYPAAKLYSPNHKEYIGRMAESKVAKDGDFYIDVPEIHINDAVPYCFTAGLAEKDKAPQYATNEYCAKAQETPKTNTLAQLCIDEINKHRATINLPALARWNGIEACVDGQAKYDAQTNTPHSAFTRCKELAQNVCWWSGKTAETGMKDCLQAMWNEGPENKDGKPHNHYENMINPAYTKVACGFYTASNGAMWSDQDFGKEELQKLSYAIAFFGNIDICSPCVAYSVTFSQIASKYDASVKRVETMDDFTKEIKNTTKSPVAFLFFDETGEVARNIRLKWIAKLKEKNINIEAGNPTTFFLVEGEPVSGFKGLPSFDFAKTVDWFAHTGRVLY